MKKQFTFLFKIALVFLLVGGLSTLFAQNTKVNFENNWGKQGLTVVSQDKDGIIINTSINSYDVIPTIVENETLQTILTEGVYLQNDEGAPNLPAFSSYIAVPQGAVVKAKITNKKTATIENIAVSPAPVIPKDDDKGPLVYKKNQKIYNTNTLYPKNIIQISEPMKIRGMDVVLLGISPFQYNPITQELVINRDIEIEITFKGGNGQFGEDRLRNRWWDPIIHDAVINSKSIQEASQTQRSTDQVGCEYLIIVPDDPTFISWADSLKNFRNRQGILTDVKTTTEVGGNTVSAIEAFIDTAYDTWDIPPSAVLLMADYGEEDNTIISPIYNNYCASDNIFADVDNDHMPDVIFARMTAQNEEHLETFVTKVLNYERTPPTSPDFYNHPITALGWQTERWFQICSETVGGFFKTIHGKDPVRINAVYGGNPSVDPWSTATNTSTIMNYFGPNGLGYIPTTPAELGGWSGGTSADVNNALNNGAFILQHRDHGSDNGWGEPSYNSNSINGLTNTDLSFIFSINCLTGKFNNPNECFTEKFHRYKYNDENAGALGLIAASEVSYSFVNDTYVWGMYDNMWPEFLPDYGSTPVERGILPAFGNAAGKYFLKQSSWPYNTGNKQVTYNLFHHHGDAFSVVYSEVPQTLTVVHNTEIISGETNFSVSADDGSFIALSVDNIIIGTAEGTGSSVTIEIEAQYPPSKIVVTVTKQNYYRYESAVIVVPPVGPYVIFNAVSINNSTGLMTTNEATSAEITVKNIGVEEGQNVQVELSTTDAYIEITDNSEDYGSIAAGATASIPDGFSWNVANNIPDMYIVEFNIESTDGVEIWGSKMNITAHAPQLSVGNITFDDTQNGNGNHRLDAGETVDIIIATNNDGSSSAIETIGTLTCSSSFIDIINEEFTIGDIESNETVTSIFTIEVADDAIIGSIFEFTYNAVSGEYNTQKEFFEKAGIIVEDWETGDMSKYPWATGGSGVWEVSTSNPYEGIYSAITSEIGDQQSTWLSLIYESAVDDSISFFAKVSTEDGYDKFRFYIDGAEKLLLSGEKQWKKYSFPVSEGGHLYKWQYNKDDNTTGGEDCIRVDFIVLPAPLMTTVYAGEDSDFCETDNIQCQGIVSNCETVLWETSGTGNFNNQAINSPIYLPSDDDVINGSVILTFTGYGPTTTINDDVEFTFGISPEVNTGGNSSICGNEVFTLSNATAENYTTLSWTTLGDGVFDDPVSVNPIYTPGETDIENGITTLILTATGSDICGDITEQMELTINTEAVAYAGIDADICPMLTYTALDATATNYESLVWSTSGDGTFDDINSSNPIYTPGDNDKVIKEAKLTMTASFGTLCPESIDEMTLTLLCTDIAEEYKSTIKLYPNPNDGSFNLRLENNGNEIVNISVYDTYGKLVYNETDINIENNYNMMLNIDSKPGIYTIRIDGSLTKLSKKFIIK